MVFEGQRGRGFGSLGEFLMSPSELTEGKSERLGTLRGHPRPQYAP